MNLPQHSALKRDSSVQQFLKPFDLWNADEGVTEIVVNRTKELWFEKQSKWSKVVVPEITKELMKSLGQAVATFANQSWDDATPLLSASLPSGARMQFVGSPAVENDELTSFTMRRPGTQSLTLDDFSKGGLFKQIRPMQNELTPVDKELIRLLKNKDYESFLRFAVKSRMNIVVSGATGSGKTTFMKGLVQEIDRGERIVTIEDVRELFIPHENAVHLLYSKGGQGRSNVTPKALLECCLRMKPDRILLAELRGDECLYFIRNAASGHPGSITSCHAGSPSLAFEQLAIMIQDSPGGANLTFDVIKRLLTLTIDIVVQFQNHDGERFISEIYFDPKKKLEARV